jgi:ADP-glucose pyrophosphorylase
MHDVVVRSGAQARRVIADKDVVFGEDSRVGSPCGEPIPRRAPLTVLGKSVQISKGERVAAGKEIFRPMWKAGAPGSIPQGAIL